MATKKAASKTKAPAKAAAKKRATRGGVTEAWVVERLKREATYEGKGASPSARVSALALLAKHTGGFSDKAEVDLRADVRFVMELHRG